MKRLNFLIIALAMAVGVASLTACLDSNDNSTRWGAVPVKVISNMGFYSFRTMDGTIITLSPESLSTASAKGIDFGKYAGQVIYLMYSWDSSVLDITENDKEISGVDLAGFAPMNSAVEIAMEHGAPGDSIENAPVISIGNESTGTTTSDGAVFFDATTLLLPIEYYLYRSQHNFTMVYYPNDEVSSDGNEMTVYLRHDLENDSTVTVGNTTSKQYAYSSFEYYAFYYRAFDFSQALNYFRNAHGLDPVENVTIRVVDKESQYSIKLDDATENRDHTYTYKAPTNG